MEFISTDNALKPAGHYSQAVVHKGTVYVSGQLAVNPETGEKEFTSVEDQTRRVLENIDLILKASGSDKKHVLKATVYVSDISDWDKVNAVYTEFFEDHKPARAVVPTRELHFGFKVEIEVVAAVIEK